MTGYRKLISDRIPIEWDMALRYVKCRGEFIERVYDRYVKPFNTNCMKSRKANKIEKERIIKRVLNHNEYSFLDAVAIDDFLHRNKLEKYKYWSAIDSWITWFENNWHNIYIYINTDENNTPNSVLEDKLIDKFNISSKLARFIININNTYL